jgi:GTP-binding protein Era
MRSGIVTIVGRPNVGKSSLLNALVGRKVSIVSHKPQTTRHRIQGVVHHEQGQIVFVDTPGLHRQQKRALNRVMNEAATTALQDIDLAVFVIEAGRWTEEDEAVLQRLKQGGAPVGLVVNKIDRIPERDKLLPELQRLGAMHDYAFIVPLSALRRENLKALVSEILPRLPEGPPLYPPDMSVGHDDRFAASETVREKLIRSLHEELPYAAAVEIEQFELEGTMYRIGAIIWVEREGQKRIVIGEDGSQLKQIGSAARRDLERQLNAKVFLRLWCKVRENWSDDLRSLRQFGISQDQ